LEATLAGGTERAGHAAAGLTGDAHGRAIGVAHEHRLDESTVEELPQRLAGRALVGLEGAQRRHEVRQERADELIALACGQVRHLGGIVGEATEVVVGELLGTEAGQPHLGQQVLATGFIEVGEVARRLLAATRFVEDEGQGLDGFIRHRSPILPPGRPKRRVSGRRTAP
jgi:hypothetical protein